MGQYVIRDEFTFRISLIFFPGLHDDSLGTSFEELEDLNGGQSHRAALNARFEGSRDIPARRSRANPRTNLQSAHSRRPSNSGPSRANNVAGSRAKLSPADPTRAGKGQITKVHPHRSTSTGRGGNGLSRGFETRGHAPSRNRDYMMPRRDQADFSRNITSPDVFLEVMRRQLAEASNPGMASTSEVARRSASPARASRCVTGTVFQQPLIDTISDIARPPASPRHTRHVPQPMVGTVPLAPRTDTPSRSVFADPKPATLLDTTESPRLQQSAVASNYDLLQGLNLGGEPMLNWGVASPRARQQQTTEERTKAQTHEHNARLDTCPPVASVFGNNSLDEFRLHVNSTPPIGRNPFTDPPPSGISISAIEHNLFTDACTPPASTTRNNLFRNDRSPVKHQSIEYTPFRDYRSPTDPPSSGESKPSKSSALPTPSFLSPKKTKGSDFIPGFEKLHLSSPTRKSAPVTKPAPVSKPAPITKPAPVTKNAPVSKPVYGLAHSIHAGDWLDHHEIRQAKVIGVKASLEAKDRESHITIYEHPVPLKAKTGILSPAPRPFATGSEQLAAGNQQQVASNSQTNATSLQRTPTANVRVLGPTPGPLSMRSQRQEEFKLASRGSQPNEAGSQTARAVNAGVPGPAPGSFNSLSQAQRTENQNPVTSDSWSTATRSQSGTQPKPTVLGIQPFNPPNPRRKL
jgi:hypothetical protein